MPGLQDQRTNDQLRIGFVGTQSDVWLGNWRKGKVPVKCLEVGVKYFLNIYYNLPAIFFYLQGNDNVSIR